MEVLMSHDSLGDRMKRYEMVPRIYLMRRTPVIIRVDGRAFHTFTKQLKHLDPSVQVTPFSEIMHEAMVAATLALVEDIQGCVLGYTQSDEITLLLRDWDTHETQAWFDYNLQKIDSLAATIASNAFNFTFCQHKVFTSRHDYVEFDARAYNIPREEVTNNFIWRQQDASRNSVQMLGHFHFSQKEMHGLSNSQVQDKLMLEKGCNWNDMKTWIKRGTCVLAKPTLLIDEAIPVFTQDRNYIEQLLDVDDTK
jgi:tRNA(His) 5'-end guanylyltransferase